MDTKPTQPPFSHALVRVLANVSLAIAGLPGDRLALGLALIGVYVALESTKEWNDRKPT